MVNKRYLAILLVFALAGVSGIVWYSLQHEVTMNGTTQAHPGINFIDWDTQNSSYTVAQQDTFMNHPATVDGLPLANHGSFSESLLDGVGSGIATIEMVDKDGNPIDSKNVDVIVSDIYLPGGYDFDDFDHFEIRIDAKMTDGTNGAEVLGWTQLSESTPVTFLWGPYTDGGDIPCVLGIRYSMSDAMGMSASQDWGFQFEIDVAE